MQEHAGTAGAAAPGGAGGGRVLSAHRIALDPTNVQRTHFARAAGTARFAWNWALSEWKRQYECAPGGPVRPAPGRGGAAPSSERGEARPVPLDVRGNEVRCGPQEAVIDLGMAFRSFFEKRGRYPRFKKRGVARDSFCAANQAGNFRVEGRRIRLPRIGWVRMRQALRFSGKPKRVTVSREAGRWFASVLVETGDIGMSLPLRRRGAEHPRDTVGVDLGVKTLAVLSTGETIPGPKAHKRLLAALRRRARGNSRASARVRRTAGRRSFAWCACTPASPTSAAMRRTRRRRCWRRRIGAS